MRNSVEAVEVPMAVAIGGALGSLARWGIADWLVSPSWPVATFITNVLGCFLLGIVLVAGEVVGKRQGHHHRRQRLHVRLWRPFLATGVLGGFTTFSTFVVELDRLGVMAAVTYMAASIVLGLLAYSQGNQMARTLLKVDA